MYIFPENRIKSLPTLVLTAWVGWNTLVVAVAAMAAEGSTQKSEEEWRAILSPEQFRILRQKGTE